MVFDPKASELFSEIVRLSINHNELLNCTIWSPEVNFTFPRRQVTLFSKGNILPTKLIERIEKIAYELGTTITFKDNREIPRSYSKSDGAPQLIKEIALKNIA
jgi:hypothetical protein